MQMFDRLRIARKKLGLNQDEFARYLGIKRGGYSDLERGRLDKISESALMLLEISFGISRDWLLHGEGEMFITADTVKKKDEVNRLKEQIKELELEVERLNGIIKEIKKVLV